MFLKEKIKSRKQEERKGRREEGRQQTSQVLQDTNTFILGQKVAIQILRVLGNTTKELIYLQDLFTTLSTKTSSVTFPLLSNSSHPIKSGNSTLPL